jgi:hypothetical protein
MKRYRDGIILEPECLVSSDAAYLFFRCGGPIGSNGPKKILLVLL